mgnify:CR=1 FL=1|jgi:hypothetical protein
MAGGIIQLIAKGPQDIFLTEDPEISFFKTVFKKHTAFAIETKEQFFNNVSFGTKSTCNIAKDGDLISNISVRITLPSLNPLSIMKNTKLCVKDIDVECFCERCSKKTTETIFGWANSIGHVLVEYAELEIGGYIIDKQYGEWFEIWSELTQTAEKKPGYSEMIGKRDPVSFKPQTFSDNLELIVPLNFYFTRNIGLALPLISIYRNEVYVNIKWRSFDDCWICNKGGTKPPFIPKFSALLYVDYVYLELWEREKFVSENHLYLIEQVQYNNPSFFVKNTRSPMIDLNFNHPAKEVVWVVQREDIGKRSKDIDVDFSYGNDWFNYSCYRSRIKNIIKDPFDSAYLMFNGQNRSAPLPAIYYRLYQTYQYHTKTPSNYIYVQSFALKPEEHQPTGSCNMSVIDKIRLNLQMAQFNPSDFNVKVYALSYNFILIVDGMLALAFAM